MAAHPYDEVAYDIYPLLNEHAHIGMGMVGELVEPMEEEKFLGFLQKVFDAKGIRHSKLKGKPLKRVAVCGGSGSFLIKDAIASGADVFVTGDFKYHQFFEAEDRIVIIDIGHYESEQFSLDLFYELLTKKFPKFAVRKSEVNTNPIKYF
jgi:putative NIF3 family GTP cyclohydrolase 1 type 2